MIFAVPSILGLAVYRYYPIHVRRETAKYLRSCTPDAYSLHVGPEGLTYAHQGDAVRYSGSSIRSIQSKAGGDVVLTILDQEWEIPAQAFETSEARQTFVDAIESLRGESAGGASWWTQEIDTAKVQTDTPTS